MSDVEKKLVFTSNEGDEDMARLMGCSIELVQSIRNSDMYSHYTRAFARGSWIPAGPFGFYENGHILFKCCRKHLLHPPWIVAADKAAKKFKAYNIQYILTLMQEANVPIDEMEEWCEQARKDWPCLFFADVFEGIQ